MFLTSRRQKPSRNNIPYPRWTISNCNHDREQYSCPVPYASYWLTSMACDSVACFDLLLLRLHYDVHRVLLIRVMRSGHRNVLQKQIFKCHLIFLSISKLILISGSLYFTFRLYWRKQDFIPIRYVTLSELTVIIESLALSPLFIFCLAKILLYRVLDPLKKVGFEFFLPKMLVSALIAIIGVFLFLKRKVETIESSFISAIVI